MYVCSAAISLIPLNLGDMLIQLEKAIFLFIYTSLLPTPTPPSLPFPLFLAVSICPSIHSFFFIRMLIILSGLPLVMWARV